MNDRKHTYFNNTTKLIKKQVIKQIITKNIVQIFTREFVHYIAKKAFV